jgi:hypothetical protein
VPPSVELPANSSCVQRIVVHVEQQRHLESRSRTSSVGCTRHGKWPSGADPGHSFDRLRIVCNRARDRLRSSAAAAAAAAAATATAAQETATGVNSNGSRPGRIERCDAAARAHIVVTGICSSRVCSAWRDSTHTVNVQVAACNTTGRPWCTRHKRASECSFLGAHGIMPRAARALQHQCMNARVCTSCLATLCCITCLLL